MRIIAGRHRGTKLAQPAGADTRPTADRVRESLFNILEGGRFGRVIEDAIVIDAFAGTGALGLEALSRGAKSASFIERDQESAVGPSREYRPSEAGRRQSRHCGRRDKHPAWRGPPATLMFADAPYGSGGGFTAARCIAGRGGLVPGALVIIETDKSEKPPAEEVPAFGLTMLDSRHYGRASLHFLEFTS